MKTFQRMVKKSVIDIIEQKLFEMFEKLFNVLLIERLKRIFVGQLIITYHMDLHITYKNQLQKI